MQAPPNPPPAGAALRARVMRGGAIMVLRQGLGMLISLVGVVLITREIGPEAYGLFVACLGVYTYFYGVARWGVDVYLIRRAQGDVDRWLLDVASTLLMLLAVLGMAVGLALLGVLQRWVGIEGFGPMILVWFLGLPVALAQIVPSAILERDLDYPRIATIELAALIQFQGTALLLAYLGWGAWSLSIAWVLNQVLSLAMLSHGARYLPRPAWDAARVRDMLRFGAGHSASVWAVETRHLINPLIVAPFAGAAAVGYVGMTTQFVFRLSMVKTISAKMSVAALARVRDEPGRVRGLLGEGMQLHVLAVGFPLTGFTLLAPWLIPLMMGESWRPVATLLPFVAAGYLINAVFTLHAAVLQLYDRNWQVAAFNAAHMLVMFVGSALLIPRVGWIGYGWAELLALPAYLLLHRYLTARVGRPAYAVPLLWSAGLIALLFAPWLGFWALGGLAAALLWPATWKELGLHLRQARRAAGS